MDALNRIFFQPAGGMYRAFRGLKAYVEPKDLSLYRRLLPEPFDMPELPTVNVLVADFITVRSWTMPSYREAAIALQSRYCEGLGWYMLTMPVTNRFAMRAGRSVGFPKHIVDEISLVEDGRGWRGQVSHRGVMSLSLEFQEGDSGPLSPWMQQSLQAETFFHGDMHLLVSASPRPRVGKAHFVPIVPSRPSLALGRVFVTIPGSEPWSGLFAEQTIAAGAYCDFHGGMNLMIEGPA